MVNEQELLDNLIPLTDIDKHDNPNTTIHYVNMDEGWDWWICAGEKIPHTNDYLLFGIGKIFFTEMGEVTLSQIREYGGIIDLDWKPQGLYDVLRQQRGE